MKSEVFLRRFGISLSLIVIGFVVFNIYIDVFGLFLGRKDRRVYTNERTSKYLLSFRYIPKNFDGFILGPSLSANLDPTQIKNYKIYNASIMGANISDLHYLVKNLLAKGDMKVAIICLDPYLTKDFGKKSATIDPKEYLGALGSINLLKTYGMLCVRKFNLFSNRFAPNLIDVNGWNNFELEMKGLDSKKAIDEKVRLKRHEETKIDSRAYEELAEVIRELRAKDVQIVAYFSPVPYPIYSIGKNKYKQFESAMVKLFREEDILINLNDAKYNAVTSDYSTFIDHGHLSASGQAFVLREIQLALLNSRR
jgi:hypothetical protein